MEPVVDLINGFRELVDQVPELVQPFIVLLAGMVPFIEGEGGAPIGVMGGIHPIVAGLAAATGNFLAVLAVVVVSSRTRQAVVTHRRTRAAVAAEGGTGEPGAVATLEADEPAPTKPESKGKQRLKRWLVRFGVPGASLLGPLAIPTHFTAATLIASGVPRGWVLLWQGIAIVVWTTLTTTLFWLAVTAVLA